MGPGPRPYTLGGLKRTRGLAPDPDPASLQAAHEFLATILRQHASHALPKNATVTRTDFVPYVAEAVAVAAADSPDLPHLVATV